MKAKHGWLAALVVAGLVSSAAGPISLDGSPVRLVADGVTMLLVGETLTLNSEPGHPAGDLTCRVEGEALTLADSSGSAALGFRFVLGAVKAGEAVVSIKGEASEDRYQVRVMEARDVPLITTAALHADPKAFRGQLFKLSGANRGWGAPAQAKEVWGELVTRSDWVLEDDTGAVYITGVPRSEAAEVTVIGFLAGDGKKWAVSARRAGPRESPAPVPDSKWEGKEDLTQAADKENVLTVGQVGLIVVYPNRSEIFDFEIAGDAVSVVKSNPDALYVRADKVGTAEVRTYLRHFLDLDLVEPEGERKPSQVFKIRVEAKK